MHKQSSIRQEEDPPPCSLGNVYSQEQKRNIPQIVHLLEAWQEIYTVMPEQTGIYQHEIGFARAQEFQGRHTIRRDDDLVARPLCQNFTELCCNDAIILDEQKLLYGG